MNATDRITINPEVCGGRPIISGTRLRVADILEMLAGGASEAEILADFPFLASEDVRASLTRGSNRVSRRSYLRSSQASGWWKCANAP